MGKYLFWGSEWGMLAKVQGEFIGAFECYVCFHWCIHYVHFIAEFEGRGQERAERGTCGRSQLIILECLVTCGHLGQVLTAHLGGWPLRQQEQRRREL